MDPIHIVCAADDKYAKPMAVMLYSLLTNKKSSNTKVYVHIIDAGISYKNKKRIERVAQKFRSSVRFLHIDSSIYKGCLTRGRFGKEVYYRISIPDILPSSVQKAIYLDCDLIVKADINKLWGIHLDPYFLAAVDTPAGMSRYKALQIPPHSYFNSGVMVMNLNKWRKYQVTKKIIRFVQKHPSVIKFPDQDGLNAILHDKWLRLHPKWNYYTSYLRPLSTKPAIIHYNGVRKPWSHHVPFQGNYLKYASKVF